MQMACHFILACTCCDVCFNSPLIVAVTWSLLMPMLFLTSQTKVVLTLSSTFSTLSSLPEICTESGTSPDMLRGHEHIWRKKKRERDKQKEMGFVICVTTGTMSIWLDVHLLKCVVLCNQQNSVILIGSAKPISFPKKEIHYHTEEENTTGTEGKSNLLDTGQKYHLSHFKVPTHSFFYCTFRTVMIIADNTEKRCFLLCKG